MRKELEIIQIIEKYLNNELSATDRAKFEEKLSTNSKLVEEVEKQRLIQEGVKNMALKTTIQKAWKAYQLGKFGFLGGMGLLVVVGIGLGMMYFSNSSNNESWFDENIKYSLNENQEEVWADADEYLAPQFFEIDANKDQVLQTESGITIAIPKGALLQNGKPVTGNVEIEFKEALNPEDILQSGLTTMSGDEMLETGGMFYFNARKDGENLTIDPNIGVGVDVPSNGDSEGMQLYDGVRKEDGSIDWQNPKPLEDFLTTVDIFSLDFYPPGYENRVNQLGHRDKNKAWRDSLYYSFAVDSFLIITSTYENENIVDSIIYDEHWISYNSISPSKIQTIWSEKYQNTLIATKEFEQRLKYIFESCDDRVLDLYVNNLDKRMATIDSMVVELLCGTKFQAAIPNNELDGKALFNANCASCHQPTKNSVGPELAGARSRWANAGESELIYEYIADPAALTSSGKSDRAIQLKSEYVVEMNPQGLTKQEIDAVFNYVESFPIDHSEMQGGDYDTTYVNLWTDSTAVAMVTAADNSMSLCDIFLRFAQENKGRVEDGDKLAQLLAAHYEKQSKAFAQAARATQLEMDQQYTQVQEEIEEAKAEKAKQETDRKNKNYEEEYNLNLEEACRQLGIKKPPVRPSSARNTARITSPGWKNIDRAVAESVSKRKTLDFKDQKGRTAKIEYKEITVKVMNESEYDRVMVYLLPDQLNSFQRIMKKGKVFKNTLNELINYNLLVVGYKNDQIYTSKVESVVPKAYELSLKASSQKELKKELNGFGKKSITQSINDEVEYQQTMYQLNQEQVKLESIAHFRELIRQVIFPCSPRVEC